jgi:hypothetical protein
MVHLFSSRFTQQRSPFCILGCAKAGKSMGLGAGADPVPDNLPSRDGSKPMKLPYFGDFWRINIH